MSTVRCPRARCSRTRRMAAGNDFVRMRSLNISTASASSCVDVGAVVAAVEVAEEVAAVAAVGGEQRGRLAQRLEHEAEPVLGRQPAGGEPRVRRDDVRRDERVLEVEGGEVAGRVEHLAAQAVLALLAGAAARRGAHAGVLDDRRQVDLGRVVVPVDDPRVEAEGGLVLGIEGGPALQQAVDAVDRLALGVGAVELDVGEGPLDLLALLLEGGGPRRLLAAEREGLQDALAPLDGALGPLELALHAAPTRERPLGDDDRLALGVVDRVLGEEGAAPCRRGGGSAAGSPSRTRPA